MAARCKVHGGILERARWDGERYPHPGVCFECIPDHRDHCPALDHVMLAAVFYERNLTRDPHFYDLNDAHARTTSSMLRADWHGFLASFGPDVTPACECRDRLRMLGPRDTTPSKKPSAKVCNVCSMNGPKVENWTWRECRVLLAPMLAETLPAGLERMQVVPANFVIALHPWCLQKAVKARVEARAEVTSLSVHP